MACKIHIEYAGAAYHVMARGNQGRDIYADARDRKLWLATLGEACEKTGWRIHAWVVMNNHYRLPGMGDESRVTLAVDRLKRKGSRKGQSERERLKRRLEQVYEDRNGEAEV